MIARNFTIALACASLAFAAYVAVHVAALLTLAIHSL